MHVSGDKPAAIRRWFPALLLLAIPWDAHATHRKSQYPDDQHHDVLYSVDVGLIGEDELGIAIAQAYNGDAYRSLAARADVSSDRAETNIELTWRIPVAEWLVLQPDVQYIINPGTNPQLRDALVVGLRFELTGERAW